MELPEHSEAIYRILPDAQSVMVVVAKHSLAAINSQNIQMGQFDTIHAYNECARAAHEVSRFLESEDFPSVAVPAFIPIDMEEPKKGMCGEICWRRAGVKAGLGSYGDEIFKYGFRYFANFMQDLIQKPKSEMKKILKGYGLREMWQTFMTGNYYYCFQCQSRCPTTKLQQRNQ